MAHPPLVYLGLASTLLLACGGGGAETADSSDTAGTTMTEGTGETASTTAGPGTSAGTDTDASGSDTGGATTTSDTDATTSAPTTSDTEPATDTEPETDSDATTDTPWEPTPGALCEPIPTCEAALPGNPNIPEALNHRGRDMFYVEGEDQWVLAKFAEAGILDFDLENEEVAIYLLRDCEGPWEFLGMGATTDDGDHPTVEGIEDTGGRLYYQIPEDKKLGPGRHRIHMILTSDNSRADQYIDVVPPGAPLFVTDVDGTLTTSEFIEFVDLLLGTTPMANAFASQALGILESKGYHPMYVTARPEFLYKRTREFVEVRGFPNGIIHTSLSKDGALGSEAEIFKTDEFSRLADKGLVPTFVIGNSESDADAYNNAGIMPLDHRIFFQYDDVHGGRTIDSYQELLADFEALPDHCEPP
ncbi:MAG: phosphatidylinositol transfer protein [Myxococcales bacterium]|nr:phosphatidylinositol transfer protein [Myxococcales bacterium]